MRGIELQAHLVDGTYELFRAFYGSPRARSAGGEEVGATRTLVRSLLSMINRDGATHIAVAFDHVIESFRNELFAGYKTGDGIDPRLRGQFDLAEEATRALGMTVWPMVEFEADDALATAAASFSADARIERILICTPDKDLAQCIVGTRVVCLDRRRKTVRDEDAVVEKFGVRPASIPDWLALVGDTADGIPGLPGWGPRSSAVALAEYEHIESIPLDPDAWRVKVRGAERLAATLADRREDALLYRKLATLRTDATLPGGKPLVRGLDEIEWRGAHRAALTSLCERIGLRRVLERVPRWSEDSA